MAIYSYVIFAFAPIFVILAVVLASVMGWGESYSIVLFVSFLVLGGLMLFMGFYMLSRSRYIDRIVEECDVSKYDAWQALIINKWRLKPAMKMIKKKNKKTR